MDGPLKILLIDDDEVDRMAVRRALRKSEFSFELMVAENGKSGLERLDTEPIDIIILDYRLPDFSGLDLLEKIRDRDILAPVIVVTSHGDENIAAEAFKSGASDYLSKDLISGKGLDRSIQYLLKLKEGEEQRRAAVQAMREAKQLAEKNAKVKEEFLANMSHEIRTPMNAIIGFTHLLADTSLTEKQKEYVSSIVTAGENLLVIINDILDFSKIEAGKLSIEAAPFNLKDLLTSTFNLFKPKAEDKGLDLRLSIPDGLEGEWNGDAVRLNQILINLVGNAIKFTEEGWVELSVEPKKVGGEAMLDFRITDTGIGIHPDKVSSIFDSFTQGAADTTMKFGGTGLGLAIVKNLVELMDGRVSAESELGKGSVFSFQLPLKSLGAAEGTQKDAQAQAGPDLSELEDALVLMAEDNKMNQLLARRILEEAGVDLKIVENGRMAVEAVEKRDFDLILMDVQMPEMDGLDATRAIRALDPPANEIPILALTAHAVASEIQKCFESGMNDYVVKPYKPAELLRKMVHMLSGEWDAPKLEFEDKEKENKWAFEMFEPELLKEVASGNDVFLLDLIETFLDENLPGLKEMEQLRKEDKKAEMASVLHRIKPGFEMMGVKGSKPLIAELEDLLRADGDWKTVDKLFEDLTAIGEKSGREIREYLSTLKRLSSV